MYRVGSFSLVAFALASLLMLSACESAEDRAEEHFQSGLSLLEEGDVDRAILEFRNAFKLDPAHVESRRELGRVLLEEQNDKPRAYRQFLRVAEQNPDDLEARIVLSEIAFTLASWDEVERHGDRAATLAPENPRVQAISLARSYREATRAEAASEMRDLAQQARQMLDEQPDNVILRTIRVDSALRESEYDVALNDIDWMLERDPDNEQLLNQRLAVLAQVGDTEAVEAQLRDMIARDPGNDTHKTTLLRFYMANDMTDKAEDFMRELAQASEGNEGRLDLVNFLREVRGPEAANAQLDQYIAESENPLVFQLVKAAMEFDAGDRDAAITRIENALQEAPENAKETLDAKGVLARMQLAAGNEVGARALVAEVLSQDDGHPEALKLQAAWQIDADEVETAIANLRTVLDREPEDATAMTLMAQAYMRSGQSELAQDFLALAVEASSNAPAESIRYAQLLMERDNPRMAEEVLMTALRRTPQDIRLLSVLGELYVATDDLGRLEQVIGSLRSFDTPQALEMANRFEVARINRQSGTEDALQYLESLSTEGDGSLATRLRLVQARLQSGNVDGALEEVRAMADENPDNPAIAMLLGATESAAGNLEAAESIYRDIVTRNPQIDSAPWQQLAQQQARQGNFDDAEAVIDEALTHLPEDGNLLWAKASYLERDNDIDGAIRIYEELYERNSGSVIVANNLASLLSTYKSDDESLERAWIVARRFRDTDIPQMQDTYGWIQHRRGNIEEARPYLEDAAAALTNDPIVQYHLGQNYLSLDRKADARMQFQKAVDLANPADQRPQIVEARTLIETLDVPADNESQ